MKIIFIFLFIFNTLQIISIKLKNSSTKQFDQMVENLKKTVVMIEISSDLTFMDEHTMNSVATGFVVDEKLGIIATNKHVTRKSPTRHSIRFHDGSVQKGTVIYYDIYHDFGFIQLDFMRKDNKEQHEVYKYLKAVELGSSYDVNVGDELLLIGNNEGVNYSVKKGHVTVINMADFDEFGSIIETTFDRAGGSSGSPCWDRNGKVVAIHAMGDKMNSYEVPIDNLKLVLEKIIENLEDNVENPLKIDKGYLGINMKIAHIYKIDEIQNSNKTSIAQRELFSDLKVSQREEQKKTTDALRITSLALQSPAENKLMPGDIIMKINDHVVGNDMIYYENVLDGNINKELKFTVFRFGKIIQVDDVKVFSTKDNKFDEFIKFSNTVIHPVNFSVKFKYPLLTISQGVFISQIGLSSPFNDINSSGSIVLYSINGVEVNSLKDLIHIFETMGTARNINVEAKDLTVLWPKTKTYSIDIKENNDVYYYKFNYDHGGWDKEPIHNKSEKK